MQMKMVSLALILVLGFLQGCSSIVHGTTQDLQINTVPQGARATVGTQTCVTPCTLNVKRDSATVQIEKDSYRKTFDLEKNFQWGATLFGNILWAELGIIIDVASGAAWDIRPVNIGLNAADSGLQGTNTASEPGGVTMTETPTR